MQGKAGKEEDGKKRPGRKKREEGRVKEAG